VEHVPGEKKLKGKLTFPEGRLVPEGVNSPEKKMPIEGKAGKGGKVSQIREISWLPKLDRGFKI